MNSTTETRSTTALKSTGLQTSVRTLDVAFDVGSLTLNWSVELGGKMINGECANDSRDIRKTLGRIMNEASQQDYLVPGIRILCESTGIYHRRLLQIASHLGMQTNLDHGEENERGQTTANAISRCLLAV